MSSNKQAVSGNGTNGLFQYWKQDFLASLVVFLVALPLCMGIALASGAPVAAGLITGIVGGLLVGTFAGSPLQVSGPAAGLTVICGEIIRQNGMSVFGIAVLLGGVIQLLAGLCRLGQWFRAVSPAVIHGMLSGIGVLILCGQLHVLVDERPRENAIKNMAAIPDSLSKGLAIPEWDSADVRTSRIELLRRFNALGNRQRTLRGGVERALLRLTAADDETPTTAPAASLAEVLQPFAGEQQKIVDEYSSIQALSAVSPLVSIGGTDAKLLTGLLAEAGSALNRASAHISSEDKEAVARSQKAAAESIDSITASLKRHDWAGKIGLLAVAIIFAWQFLAKGKLKLIPAPLLAIVITTLVAQLLQIPILYVDVPNSLLDGMTLPSLSVFADTPIRAIVVPALVIAIVASAETLLCATAVDQMHTGPRTRYDRELSAQGIGNMVCGFLGALPMTGVIVRSAANVQAGGRTRLSAILHGIWLLLFSVALTPVLRMIPTAALAGILVYTGFRLIDFKGLIHLWKENRFEAAIFLTTVIVIVAEDLLTGVMVGVVLSALKLLLRFSTLDIETTTETTFGRRRSVITLVGAATFLRLPKLAAALDKIPADSDLHVDVSEIDYIDRACMELLQNWARQHAATGGQLTIDWDSLHSRFQTNRPRGVSRAT